MLKVGDLVKPNCFLNFSETGRIENIIVLGKKISYLVRFRLSTIEFEHNKVDLVFAKKKNNKDGEETH